MKDLTSIDSVLELTKTNSMTKTQIEAVILYLRDNHTGHCGTGVVNVIYQSIFLYLFGYGKDFTDSLVKVHNQSIKESGDERYYFYKLWRNSLNSNSGDKFGLSAAETKTEKEHKMGVYAYIPSDTRDFLKLINKNKKFKKKHFIDVGSGPGGKVFFASIFGNFETCSGVEITKSTYRISKHLKDALQLCYYKRNGKASKNIYEEPLKFHNADGCTYDFSKYDFIYMYVPMFKEGLKDLYRNILVTAPVGAVIVDYSWNSYIHEVLKDFRVRRAEDEKYRGDFLHKLSPKTFQWKGNY